MPLEDLLDLFACGYGRPKKRRRYQPLCGVMFQDLNTYPLPPPDVPQASSRLGPRIIVDNEAVGDADVLTAVDG